MLHGLLRLRVSRFGLSVCFVAMLLAQIGCMDLAATGLLGVIAVTLTLLRFRRTLLHISLTFDADHREDPPSLPAVRLQW